MWKKPVLCALGCLEDLALVSCTTAWLLRAVDSLVCCTVRSALSLPEAAQSLEECTALDCRYARSNVCCPLPAPGEPSLHTLLFLGSCPQAVQDKAKAKRRKKGEGEDELLSDAESEDSDAAGE